jgi:hypothetical protein
VAALALGNRGTVIQGRAPEFPPVPGSADVVLLLDMLHYLDDEIAGAVFSGSCQALAENGILVTRFVIPPVGRPSWSWYLEDRRIQYSGHTAWYRTAERMAELMKNAGFMIRVNEVSSTNPELVWLVGQVSNEHADAGQHA